jgi:hypothetical protein
MLKIHHLVELGRAATLFFHKLIPAKGLLFPVPANYEKDRICPDFCRPQRSIMSINFKEGNGV